MREDDDADLHDALDRDALDQAGFQFGQPDRVSVFEWIFIVFASAVLVLLASALLIVGIDGGHTMIFLRGGAG